MTQAKRAEAVPADTSNKVLELSKPPAPKQAAIRPQKLRRRRLLLSFVLCVLIPLAAAVAYYGVVATDRYAARAGFSVRGIEAGGTLDGLGALTGLASSGSTKSDSYIVLDFLHSRRLVEDLDAKHDLRGRFADAHIDFFSRMDRDAPIEEFLDHWNQRLSTQYDAASGIIEFEVQSTSPQHARDVALSILGLSQDLVNKLSNDARQDSLKFARSEVALQEARLRQSLDHIRQFRNAEQSIDPSASAALDIGLLSDLETRLVDAKARIAAQRETLDDTAPSLVALHREVRALQEQIDQKRMEIGAVQKEDGAMAVGALLERYETLQVERELAERAYASALTSLEQARRDADRQQRYLAVHMAPEIPEKAEYPRRWRNILVAAFALFSVWGIGALLAYSVRDHLT